VTPRLVLVTDPTFEPDVVVAAARAAVRAVGPGGAVVQWRDKRPSPDLALARALREATRGEAIFVTNGDPSIALAIGADGVHLGGVRPDVANARAALGPEAWISVAAHDDDDVRFAAASGARAALVSPVFQVPGKEAPRGLSAIRAARAIAPDLLVFALGGVRPQDARPCRSAGADGVAVIRAVFAAADPAAAARALVG
jgi:thiamine-phosphate pyrophosphorylase